MAAGSRHDRRQFMRYAAMTTGALAIPSLVACGSDDGSGGSGGDVDELVVADYGGTTREARQIAYYDSFEKAHGTRVIAADADLARFIQMAERGRSQWDGMDSAAFETFMLDSRGLLVPYPADLAESRGAPPRELTDPAIAEVLPVGDVRSVNIGYLGGQFDSEPGGWVDFWDVRRFPGQRGMAGATTGSQLEAALLADGVAPDELYPLDFERAFAKLDELRPHIRFYESIAQGVQFLAGEAVSMLMIQNGRLVGLQKQGQDVGIVWNEAILQGLTGTVMPRGVPHREAMTTLNEWMMDPERQATYSTMTGYGPSNAAALELLDAETLARIPNSPEHLGQLVRPPVSTVAEVRDEYVDEYLRWVTRG